MNTLKIVRLLLLTLMSLTFANTSLAFGPNGHRIVARIAEDHLNPEAKAAINKISGGKHLAQLATWSDEIRSDSSWDFTKPWHYVSIDDDESFNGYRHSEDGDILLALANYEKVLTENSANSEDMWQALAFYIHFVGDIHQPLHVGRRDDRGGNSIKVKWFNRNTNLHSVWDSSLIENEQLSFREYASFLDIVTDEQIKSLQNSTYLDWAKESKSLREEVYDFGMQQSDTPNLGYKYAYESKGIIGERMVKSGIRLAGKLNTIFSSN